MIDMPFVVAAGGHLPTRGHEDDAGLDLYISQRCVIEPGEFQDLPTAVSGALPAGYWGLLTGRSSTLRNRGLLVHPGVIDVGYRGELFVGVMNLTSETVVVEPGVRIAQLIPVPMPEQLVQARAVEQLPDGSRGDNGFGSTGN